MKKISIIIPAKDEEQRLPKFLNTVIEYCKQSSNQYEIIVVDDGSQDKTAQEAILFQKQFSALKVISLERNHGKGYAVKRGFFEARGDIVLFLDADGSTGPQEIERYLPLFDQGYDVVIGSRVVTDESSKVKTLFYRRWIGKIFNFLVHSLLIKNVKDTQCGFKMFRAIHIPTLFGRLYLEGFAFDLELLHLAQKMNLRIQEVAVNWKHVEGSKVNLIMDSWSMFCNIFQIKNWHYTLMNTSDQHMSVRELKNMYDQEKDHWWFRAKGEFFRNILSNYEFEGKFILDAGCGTGHNMEFLRSKGYYVGCDVMFEALEFCKQNGVKDLFQGNLRNVPLRSECFDVVVALDVIEHVPDPRIVLEEIKRVLKNDGILVLAVPSFRFLWSQHDEALSHFRRYNRQDLINELRDSGFQVDRVGYMYVLIFIPVVIFRFFCKFFMRIEDAQSDTSTKASPLINQWLIKFLKWEAQYTFKGCWPFGTSLYAIASKRT